MPRVPLHKLKRWLAGKLTSRRGKLLAKLFSFIEVATLEALTFLDRTLLPGIYKRVMWMLQGSWGSVVVPLGKNIDASVQVLPTEEIFEIARRANVKAVGNCYCRWRNKDFRYPGETCLILGEGYDLEELARAEKLVPGTRPRHISDAELAHILEECDRLGLVHQLIFFPSPRYFYVICNCAPESCSALRSVIRWGSPTLVKANFVERTERAACTACGACVSRCPFAARHVVDGALHVNPGRCFGCGLCVRVCPEDAITLVRRAP